MTKFLKPYIFILSLFAILIAIFGSFSITDLLSPSFIVLFCALLYAEIGYISYGSSYKATLTMPLITYGILTHSSVNVYIAIVIYNLVYRIFNKIKEKSEEPIFNIKLLFNTSVQIILAFFTLMLCHFFVIDTTLKSIFMLWMMNFVLIILNGLLTTTAVYLSGVKIAFKEYRPLSHLHLVHYYTLITAVVYLVSKAYGFEGLLIGITLVLFTQTTTLSRSSSKAINDRLILDKLTAAYNRAYMEEVISARINKKKPFTLTFIDLDDFKSVNDAYGHIIGDNLLIDFVAIIKTMMGKGEMLFRYGGDEFCVFSPGTESIMNLKKNVDELVFVFKVDQPETLLHYHISSGEYYYTGKEDLTFQEVINYVDQHMYRKKRIKQNKQNLS